MIELTMVLTGLLGYLPERGIDHKIDSMSAYVVDATGNPHARHIAGLVIPAKNIVSAKDHELENFEAGGETVSLVPIEGYRLSVWKMPLRGLDVNEVPASLPECPISPEQVSLFNWMMPLSRIYETNGRYGFVESPDRYKSSFLEAIVDLPMGKVEAILSYVDSCGGPRGIALWEIQKGSGGRIIRSAMAEMLVLTTDVDYVDETGAPRVQICFCDRFRANGCVACEKPLLLKGDRGDAGGKLTLGVVNVPRKILSDPSGSWSKCGDLDLHFPELFQFVRQPRLVHIPRIVDVCRVAHDDAETAYLRLFKRRAANNAQCPGGSLEGFD